jgi:hypothetical protein
MTEAFLLPCACGQKVRVGKAQAGQAVACTCGKSLSVPTLRALRELEVAPPDERPTKARKAAAWSPWHGAAFSGGLAVAAISLLLFGINLFYLTGAAIFSEDHTDKLVGSATGELDLFSAEQMLNEWNSMVKEGLGHPHRPYWVTAQESAKVYRWRTIAFASVSVVSLLVSLGAVFVGRSSAREHAR